MIAVRSHSLRFTKRACVLNAAIRPHLSEPLPCVVSANASTLNSDRTEVVVAALFERWRAHIGNVSCEICYNVPEICSFRSQRDLIVELTRARFRRQ